MDINKTIMLVDDQKSVIKSLKRILVMEGYTIVEASGGMVGLEILKATGNSIRLIISDQRMPCMTGVEFFRKSQDLSPDSIKFILSGYSDKEIVDEALKNRVIHRYLTKPWDNHELLLLINKVFNDEPIDIKNDFPIIRTGFPENAGIFDFEIQDYEDNIHDLTMGRLSVEHNLVNSLQLREVLSCLKREKKSGKNVSLENVLFEKGMITSDDIGRLIAATKRRLGKEFGKEATEKFVVAEEDVSSALRIQSDEFRETTTCRELGDILVAEGMLDEEQRESIVIDQLYAERIILYPDKNIENEIKKTDDNADAIINNDQLIKDKKNTFFRQRAIDKVLCKSAIKKGGVTSEEVNEALQKQLSHFSGTFRTLPVDDILQEMGLKIESLLKSKPDKKKQSGTLPSTVTLGKNDVVSLHVSADRMSAYINFLPDTINRLSLVDLQQLITDYGIKEKFLNKKLLRRVAESPERFKNRVKIARGKLIQYGRNAFIRYHFDKRRNKGRVIESGTMDYKSREPVQIVPPNFLLATKHPLIKGRDGVDIFGEIIKSPEYSDESIICGPGIILSDNSCKIFSTIEGRPDISNDGSISVLQELTINGDINFSTGNVQFEGDIFVKGAVLSGFKVKGSNLVTEEIQEADVIMDGDVIVHGGIIGGTVRAEGSITATFVKGATLFAGGDIKIKQEIIETSIQTGGACSVEKGRIVASFISAKKHIEAVDIGTVMSQPSILRTGVQDYMETVSGELNKQIDNACENLKKTEADLFDTRQQIDDIQKKLGKLAFRQEELLREKQQLKTKLHRNNDKDEKGHVINKLTDANNASKEMDMAISLLFDEQEQAITTGADLETAIKAIKSDINSIKSKRDLFCNNAKKENATPLVKATGLINTGTVILCDEGAHVVTETVKNSKVQMGVSKSFGNRTFTIEPLGKSSKNKTYNPENI